MHQIIRDVVTHMSVDTFILNSGLWGDLNNEKKVRMKPGRVFLLNVFMYVCMHLCMIFV